MARTTHKKVKVIGKQEYINRDTGELVNMDVIQIEDRDFNFHKLWLSHIIQSMDLIGNQKTRLAFWIIENLNRENQLVGTYRQISERTGISYKTVCDTMQLLIECDFLRKVNIGVFAVNPDIIFKGTANNRMSILLDYKQL